MRRLTIPLITCLILSSLAFAAAPPASWQLCDGRTMLNFAASPITTARDGVWPDPMTWVGGEVPGPDDNVLVLHNLAAADLEARNILIYGDGARVQFNPNVSAVVKFQTIQVTEHGSLVSRPRKGETHRFVVRNLPPIGAAELSNGILGFGDANIDLQGVEKTPYVQVSNGATAGQTSLPLRAVPEGWASGDQVGIADTRQPYANASKTWVKQAEITTYSSIIGQSAQVLALRYAHPACKDSTGATRAEPSLANLSRNLIIESEDPAGIRGHTFAAERTRMLLRYVEFRGMGRTEVGAIDDSNLRGFYPVHLHHNELTGNIIEGVVVRDPLKWAVVVHRSNGNLIARNVTWGGKGASFVQEDGTEIDNRFIENLSIGITGLGVDYNISLASADQSIYTWGSTGFGFVARNGLNDWVGNRAEGVVGFGNQAGFNLFFRDIRERKLPGPGGALVPADARLLGQQWQGKTYRFDSNLTLGSCGHGFAFWDVGGQGSKNFPDKPAAPFLASNVVACHAQSRGVRAYESNKLTIQGAVIGADAAKAKAGFSTAPTYQNELTLRLELDRVGIGVAIPTWGARTILDRCVFRNCKTAMRFDAASGNQTPKPVDGTVAEVIEPTFIGTADRMPAAMWERLNPNSPANFVYGRRLFITLGGTRYEYFDPSQLPDRTPRLSTKQWTATDPNVAKVFDPTGAMRPTNQWLDQHRSLSVVNQFNKPPYHTPRPTFNAVAPPNALAMPGFAGYFTK